MSVFHVTRRDFLRTSGVAAGGLTLGVGFTASALGSAQAPDPTELNAFVHIAPNGDTVLYCGRCEMGQGISTALPAAVADELEADWSRVTVLQGDGDAKYGPQNTGGSKSINVMFTPMREAGAAAQAMLVTAAAQRWNLPVDDCYADNHVVRNRQDDRQLGYGELAADAAKLDVPDSPRLKQPDQFRYIGKPLPRHDMADVVTGRRTYGADTRIPGMKYAAIRHVPVMGGAVKSFDATAARAMPGVVDVIAIDRFENAYGSLGGIAVVADTTWQARKALDAVQVEFEPGPHGGYDSSAYKAELVSRVEQPCEKTHERGDLAGVFDAAQSRHKATYTGGHLSHSPMEPMASTVWVREDDVEVWASTQDPAGIQRTLGAFLGREPESITVHVMMAGGAFGRKFKCDYVQEAAALSRAVGAPVHLTWSREEDTRTGYYHSLSAQHIEASMDAEGNVTGWLHRAAFPAIRTTFDPSVDRPSADDLSAVSDHPYGIANMQVESGLSPAHTRIGWYRAVYAIFYGYAINVFTHELAEKAGKDPLDFYRQIYANNTNPEQAEQVQRSLGVLNLAAEKAGWGRELPDGQGLGIAVHHSFESYLAMVVHAEVDGDDIKVHRVDCAVDCGLVLNPDQATAQMEGAVMMGMSLALYTEVSFREGAVVNSNFHDYPVLRSNEAPPEINVYFTNTDARPTGLGEPGVPTFAPALAGAIYAASGVRHRDLPIKPMTV
ncbi:xanthine dehydrogenase family protein molybdopterin-binding subunit [Marinihelvus fidelis]|uniref:Xanthine dehydrogenase family protein molybdopterin-binding subunit n=1 Tax=Marinihelvus fidelis TaxID=2613842 RepID=A0A5N0THM2_9GAMM|nr:molybdopterin cofactor-binding domain-containing protein [Marinihelvus fidelis]KAA9133356.1 xanthine dehydrogenase family protein molybdopterin-binding subunit [Marinihelvus fidelis]